MDATCLANSRNGKIKIPSCLFFSFEVLHFDLVLEFELDLLLEFAFEYILNLFVLILEVFKLFNN